MKITSLKNVQVFRANIDTSKLLDCLEDHALREIGDLESSTIGFTPPPYQEGLIAQLENAFCWHVTLEKKQILRSGVMLEKKKRIAKITQTEGRELTWDEEKAIQDQILNEQLRKALVKQTHSTAYYLPEKKLLLVDGPDDCVQSLLNLTRKAIGSLDCHPVWADDLKLLVQDALNKTDDNDMRHHKLNGELELKNSNKEIIKYKDSELDFANKQLMENLEGSFEPESVRFKCSHVSFVLPKRTMKLKRLQFSNQIKNFNEDDIDQAWRHEISVRLEFLVSAVMPLIHSDHLEMLPEVA